MPTPGPAAPPPPPPERVARAAGRVSVATVLSRIAGLLRESVFATLLGGGRIADAFVFAFRIPNLLRDFFAEGALSSAFVPTYARARAEGGEAAGFLLARRVLGTLTVVAGGIALLGVLFAPAIVAVVAWDAPPETRPLTERLTRIMWPFLPLVALAAVAMGVLNSHRRFFGPALAPAFFNVVSVVGGVVLLLLGLPPEEAVVGWAVLVVLGGLAQFLVQVPGLRAVGLRGGPLVDLRFRDPNLRTIVRRMGPVAISLAGTNLMVVVSTALASRGEGWAAWLNYAFRLVHLPIGLIGVALGTVLLASGAQRSALGDQRGLVDLARQALRLNWFLSLPAAVGLFVLAEPLIRVIFEHGRFTAADTREVASALRWYAGGVCFYAGVKAAAPFFLARGDTRTPMYCSLLGIAVNLGVAVATIGTLRYGALALAVGAGTAANYGALRFLARRHGGAGASPGLAFLGRTILASAAMAALGWGAADALFGRDDPVASRWVEGTLLLGVVALLGVFYFLAAARLGIEEARIFPRRLLRRGRG